VAGEVQKKGEERLGMILVESGEIGGRRHALRYDAPGQEICLGEF
jgi:hypothetical protein